MGKVIRFFLHIIFYLLLLSCTKTIDSFCITAKPIYLSKGESATIKINTLKQIVKHNEVWQGLCGVEKR